MAAKKRMPARYWDRYKKIVTNFLDSNSGRQPFLWIKKVNQPTLYGEDSGIKYVPTQLYGLFQYNYIRTWPANERSVSGELEGENMVLFISVKMLRENGFLNQSGYWDFNWAEDRFVLEGKVYKPSGDTKVSQASDEGIAFFVILKREDPQEASILMDNLISCVHYINETGVYLLDLEGKRVRDICNRMPIVPELNEIPKLIRCR